MRILMKGVQLSKDPPQVFQAAYLWQNPTTYCLLLTGHRLLVVN